MPLIQHSLVYPVVRDARRTVLSLPPIINGAHSAVRLACSAHAGPGSNQDHIVTEAKPMLRMLSRMGGLIQALVRATAEHGMSFWRLRSHVSRLRRCVSHPLRRVYFQGG